MVTKSITERGKRLFYFAVFLTLVLWLSTRSKPTFIYLYTITPDRIQISAELTSIPTRLSNIWSSTRDNILRKLNISSKHVYRYGLQFDISNNKAHLFLCILLAGDIATNPGPTANNNRQQLAHENFSVRCLVTNARSLVSSHKSNGKHICHLTNFQNLVHSEQADVVWVTETWFRDDIDDAEILPWGDYVIYRKDRKTRAGDVLLAVKSSSFSSSREVKLDTDLEILAVELTSYCNKKFLACCIYKPPQNINRQWLEEFNLCLAKLCSDYFNILLCGDFTFPRINWNSPEVTTGVDEVQFTELLNDYYLTQVNTFPTRGDHILDLVITSVPGQVLSIIGRGRAKYRDLSVVSRSIICRCRRQRQIIDLRDTDKSRYLARTEFNNCFIIHLHSFVLCFLRVFFFK